MQQKSIVARIDGQRIIMIEGNGFALNAHGVNSLFHIIDATLVLEGPLILLNGDSHPETSSGLGGAIRVDTNATLNATNVIFTGGNAIRGGAVCIYPSNNTMKCPDRRCPSIARFTDCEFSDNWAKDGGALEVQGNYLEQEGVIFPASLTVRGCRFVRNGGAAKGSTRSLGKTLNGGAIRVESDGDLRINTPATTVHVEAGNVFQDNTANYGKTLYADGGTGVYTSECGDGLPACEQPVDVAGRDRAAVDIDVDCLTAASFCDALRCKKNVKPRDWMLLIAFVVTLSLGVAVFALVFYLRKRRLNIFSRDSRLNVEYESRSINDRLLAKTTVDRDSMALQKSGDVSQTYHPPPIPHPTPCSFLHTVL
jgi:hypothetical protein